MPLGLILVMVGAAACSSEGDKLARQYEMLKASRANPSELCDYAKKAAGAYLASRDEERFAEWRRREADDCTARVTAAIQASTDRPPTAAKPAPGVISGELSYPSDYLPQDLVVCARDLDSQRSYCGSEAGMNRRGSSYTLPVPEGRYHVWATTKEMPGTKAYFSESVVCGLTVECNSHKPIEVRVFAGSTRKSVDPGDWYAH